MVDPPYPHEVLNIPLTTISTFDLLMSSLAMVLALGARKLPLPARAADAASLCIVILVGWLLAPALPSAAPAGVAVLGGSRLVAQRLAARSVQGLQQALLHRLRDCLLVLLPHRVHSPESAAE